jgi:hypothetical protein
MVRTGQQGQRSQKGAEATAVLEPEETHFRHYVPGERPRADQAFFELLIWRLIQTPSELPDMEEVWPRAVQALSGMNLLRLSTLTPPEILEATAMVGGDFHARLADKSENLIAWADSFWRIKQIYGSFRQYLRSWEADGFDALMEDIKLRLPGLTPEFLTGYLREAGEKVPQPVSEKPRRETRPPETQARPQTNNQPRSAPEQPQPQREGGGGRNADRRRRQRPRSGQRPQGHQPQTAPAQPQQAKAATPQVPASNGQPEQPSGQRRRGRRRFFRRRRSGGDKAGGPAAPPAAGA